MIFVAGITIAVFIQILLISKKDKTESDKFLFLWMFLITVHLFLFYLVFTETAFTYPFLLGLEIPLPFLHGVLLYFYVGSMTDQLPRNQKILFLHFLPAATSYLYLITFFTLPAAQKIYVYQNQGAGFEQFNTIHVLAVKLVGIIYVTWSGLLLRRHRRNIRDQFSNLEKINLLWLQILTLGLAVIWLLVIFVQEEAVTFGGAVLFVFLIAFFGIRQVGIFTPGQALPNEETQKGKYSKSGLTAERSDQLYLSLKQLMKEKVLYQKNDLSLSDLASRLEIHPNYLSQIIHEKEGKNFYDFVNTYRVEEFKRLVEQPENRQLTLLALAFDCGFNSKSSFNRYFKKVNGQTPSQYLAQFSEK